MSSPANLLANNRQWSERQIQDDLQFFERLCDIQSPKFLWIGCADSRVPANEIVGLQPGEIFVHRNIANVAPVDDSNCGAVVQYAVEVLKVEHIIVCGHYGCGGVKAALEGHAHGSIDRWIQPIRSVRSMHAAELEQLVDPVARWRRLCELNVAAQVRSVSQMPYVREAWNSGQALAIHGWIYDLRDGILRDLNAGIAALQDPGYLTSRS